MSLKKSNTDMADVYYGITPIAYIYKGSHLVWEKGENVQTAVYKFYLSSTSEVVNYDNDATGKNPVHYDSVSDQIVDGGWTKFINTVFTPVMLKSDGTEDYELSRTDYRYRADGVTPSDASNVNYDGNAMVKIKKFYVKVESTGQKYGISVSFSLSKVDNNYEALGFIDSNGNEVDYAYMSMFEGYVDSNNKLRSIAGVAPTLGNTTNMLDYFVQKAKANGRGWNIEYRSLKTALDYLHILMFKDLRPASQTGSGRRSTDGTVSLTTGQSLGKYNAHITVVPHRENNGRSKTFWIENFLDGDHRWLNGLYNPSNGLYTKNKEPYDKSDITDWTTWNVWTSSYNASAVKATTSGLNSAKAYKPLVNDSTILFNQITNQSNGYRTLSDWNNTAQYIYRSGNTATDAMTGVSDYIVYGDEATGAEAYHNSILSILCVAPSLGNGQWHRNCGARLTFLEQSYQIEQIGSYDFSSNSSSHSRVVIKLANGEYVATDWANKCCRIFNSDGSYKMSFGSSGNSLGQFKYFPYGICVDNDGYIYVSEFSDQNNTATYVTKFSYDGNNTVTPIARLSVTGSGQALIYSSYYDKIISIGYGVYSIYIINKDMSSIYDTLSTYSNLPIGLAIGSTGKIYYSLYTTNSIYEYNLTDRTSTLVGHVSDGAMYGGSCQGICLTDDEQYIIFANNSQKKIQKMKISDGTIKDLVSGNLAQCYGLTNAGNDVILFVGNNGKNLCKLEL